MLWRRLVQTDYQLNIFEKNAEKPCWFVVFCDSMLLFHNQFEKYLRKVIAIQLLKWFPVSFFKIFLQNTHQSRQTALQCLSRFNDTAASALFQLCSSVDLKLDFIVELDLDMGDVAGFSGWSEGIAVGGW